jgi:hypothetical protein
MVVGSVADHRSRTSMRGVPACRCLPTQVLYAGHPLYYYANEGANQVLCHNVREFGGLWLVVTSSGDPAP